MKGRLGIRIWEILNRESPNSIIYQIAQNILENIFDIQDTSSSGLAKVCHVSKASISRFVKELGYKDFYDFRIDLTKYTVDMRKTSAYEGYDHLGMMEDFLENCKKYIDMLKENVNEIELIELAHSIARHSQVYIMGHLHSGGTAANLQYNLFEMKKAAMAITELNQQKEIFRHLTGREMIIVFSASGSFFSDCFENGKMPEVPKGVLVYLITCNPKISDMKGMKVINARTSMDIAGCNLSLEILANTIILEYKRYMKNKK